MSIMNFLLTYWISLLDSFRVFGGIPQYGYHATRLSYLIQQIFFFYKNYDLLFSLNKITLRDILIDLFRLTNLLVTETNLIVLWTVLFSVWSSITTLINQNYFKSLSSLQGLFYAATCLCNTQQATVCVFNKGLSQGHSRFSKLLTCQE